MSDQMNPTGEEQAETEEVKTPRVAEFNPNALYEEDDDFDGESEEGQVWEAAMFAGNRGLDNLTLIFDRNGNQQTGPVDEIQPLDPLVKIGHRLGIGGVTRIWGALVAGPLSPGGFGEAGAARLGPRPSARLGLLPSPAGPAPGRGVLGGRSADGADHRHERGCERARRRREARLRD